jgi:uracil-DNA glycosylase
MEINLISLPIEKTWKQLLTNEFNSSYFQDLCKFLQLEWDSHLIFPPASCIFEALNLTPFDEVKVVILGQDPYHGPGQAHGLCFSINDGVRKPPSLLNIFKELDRDLGIKKPLNGNLRNWAGQGVLLLNATLTVRANSPGSHQKKGWERFTDKIIKTLSEKRSGIVFLLWGNFAQAKQHLIDSSKHYVLTAAHPSPLSASRGFLGCGHFSKTNEILRSTGMQEIDWNL